MNLPPLFASFACFVVCLFSTTLPSLAAPVLPSLFTDHAVLQQGIKIPVWGWAEPGETIRVQFAGQEKNTVADAGGRWRVDLDPLPACREPRDLTVTGKDLKSQISDLKCADVLVGEVWLASGQSNMGWKIHESDNAAAEIAAATNTLIRLFKVPYVWNERPQDRCGGAWQVTSTNSLPEFSAVAYQFGKKLHQELNGIPIGLIGAYWGNTRIETWTPRAAFNLKPDEFPPPGEPFGVNSTSAVTKVYNAQIAPLIPCAIRGVIWYQGENNGDDKMAYLPKMKTLIASWRDAWGQGPFPFYYAQLARFMMSDLRNPAGGDGWAWVREAQRQAMGVTNTGMICLIDTGEPYDVHPRNKHIVGQRFALWALAQTYGKPVVCSGPLYRNHTVEGSTIRLRFDYVGSGLCAGKPSAPAALAPASAPRKKALQLEDLTAEPPAESPAADGASVMATPKPRLNLFSIAGADKVWHAAEAVIDGDTVVVSSPSVPHPVAARYAFYGNPQTVSLYSQNGLPASPFQTGEP